jgi:hypothetical protein
MVGDSAGAREGRRRTGPMGLKMHRAIRESSPSAAWVLTTSRTRATVSVGSSACKAMQQDAGGGTVVKLSEILVVI